MVKFHIPLNELYRNGNNKVMYSENIYASEVYATAYGLRIGNFQIRYEE